jgi:hypothetical protein
VGDISFLIQNTADKADPEYLAKRHLLVQIKDPTNIDDMSAVLESGNKKEIISYLKENPDELHTLVMGLIKDASAEFKR